VYQPEVTVFYREPEALVIKRDKFGAKCISKPSNPFVEREFCFEFLMKYLVELLKIMTFNDKAGFFLIVPILCGI
jgi:hypothetical protein